MSALFEQELIVVPRYFDGKYSLLYQAPNYFPDVILKVWEYRGEIIYTDEDNNGGNNGNGNNGNGGNNGSGNNGNSGTDVITFGNLLL